MQNDPSYTLQKLPCWLPVADSCLPRFCHTMKHSWSGACPSVAGHDLLGRRREGAIFDFPGDANYHIGKIQLYANAHMEKVVRQVLLPAARRQFYSSNELCEQTCEGMLPAGGCPWGAKDSGATAHLGERSAGRGTPLSCVS